MNPSKARFREEKGTLINGIYKDVWLCFEKLNHDKINYVVIRGWNGKNITGADIDVLIDNYHYRKAIAIFKNFGFTKNNREFYLFDIFARENYMDKRHDNEKIRFHITDKLLFGKPYRVMRLPFEQMVLLSKVAYNNYYILNEDFSNYVEFYRELVDKYHKYQYNNHDFKNRTFNKNSKINRLHKKTSKIYLYEKNNKNHFQTKIYIRFIFLFSFGYNIIPRLFQGIISLTLIIIINIYKKFRRLIK